MFLHKKKMDQNKFEQMMAKWAKEEQQAMPELRPTREMYGKLKARRQGFLFPFFSRWATVGVAALALVVSILVLRPQFFQPSKEADQLVEKEQYSEELPQEEALREDRPRSAAPPQSEAPLLQREKGVLEEEARAPEAGERKALELGSSVSGAKDNAASLVKKEDVRMEGVVPVDKQLASPVVVPAEAPKSAPAPEPSRRSTRSRVELHEVAEMDEAVEMKSAAPQAAASAPEKRKGRAFEPQMLADDMEQEESGTRILSAPGRDSDGVAPKVFDLHEGVWIDREHSPENILILIKRGSSAFRDLLAAKPELKKYSNLYYHLIISIGSHSIEISDSGKSKLSPDELNSLFQ